MYNTKIEKEEPGILSDVSSVYLGRSVIRGQPVIRSGFSFFHAFSPGTEAVI